MDEIALNVPVDRSSKKKFGRAGHRKGPRPGSKPGLSLAVSVLCFHRGEACLRPVPRSLEAGATPGVEAIS